MCHGSHSRNVTGRACAQMELGDMSGKEKERGSCCFFDLLVELTHPQSNAGGKRAEAALSEAPAPDGSGAEAQEGSLG